MNLTPEQMAAGRRNFLRTIAGVPAVAALGAAAMVKGPVKGGRLRVGFIGVGGQGRALLSRVDPNYVEVKAMADIRPDSLAAADAVLQKAGQPPATHYVEYKDMLQHEDVEAIITAPPLWMHATIVSDCLDAGKHVLCEKMMAWDRDGYKKMMDAAARNHRVLEIGYQRNYNPIYRSAFDGVMNVSAAYGHFLDDEHPAGFIGVLATKGFKGGRTGYYVTRASNLKARVQSDPPTTRDGISYHWLIQPVVLVSDDGRSATGRLRLFQPRTGKTVGKAGDFFAASVLASTYHDGYVLEDGVWRIWELTVDPQYIRPVAFKDGIWAKAKDPAPPDPNAAPRASPPSRASRLDITAEHLGAKPDTVQWPSIKPMWFGYTNPVSGRVPELYQRDCVPCGIRPDLRFDANGYQQPPDAPAANRAP